MTAHLIGSGAVRPAAMICAGLSDPRMQSEIEATARKHTS
jgi:hypothetical protein